MKVLTWMLGSAAGALLLVSMASSAEDWMKVPQGTRVPLELVEALNTRTAVQGRKVDLRVAEDVWVGTSLVIRKGEVTQAIIGQVQGPGSFGRSGKLLLDLSNVRAVDGTIVDLGVWSKDNLEGRGYAAGASIGGAALLGPVGLVGGMFVKGRHVELPAGHRIEAAVKWDAVISPSGTGHTQAVVQPVKPTAVVEPVKPADAGTAIPVPGSAPAAQSQAGEPPAAAQGNVPPKPVTPAAPEKPVAPVIPIIEDVTGQ